MNPAAPAPPTPTGRRARRVAAVAGVGLLLAVLATAGGWWLTGGRWLDVESASMATAAPVGTLVLTRPVAVDELVPGDIVTFRAPGRTTVYTHRVVDVHDGGVRTQGDANLTPDGWTVHQGDLVGEVVARWWGVGWLLRSLPLLTLLVVSVLVGTRWFFAPEWRQSARLFLVPLTVAVTGLVVRPWVGLVMIDQHGPGSTPDLPVARLVSTGVVPVRAYLRDHPQIGVSMQSGEVGALPVLGSGGSSAVPIDAAVALTGWGWVVVVVLCALPVLVALASLDRALDGMEAPEPERAERAGREVAPHYAGVS